jgi:catalase
VADGVDASGLAAMRKALEAAGAKMVVIAKHLGAVQGTGDAPVSVDKSALTTASVEYDAVFIPGGAASVQALGADGEARHFVLEAYRHGKAIAAAGEGAALLRAAGINPAAAGVVSVERGADAAAFAKAFMGAIAQHRHWDRPDKGALPA